MADSLSPEARVALIKENLHEVMKGQIIEDVILKEKRPLVVYWGTATTGRPHCAYFVPIIKIAQLLQAGCQVKILLADIHGFLDNLKAPLELVNHRATYYKFVITALLEAVGVSISKLEFVLGSSYQLSSEYTMDLFRLSSLTTEHDAKKAGAEVVKQVTNAPLSGLLYPLMQALDEQYLGVDAQFGGVDQRKIFALASEALPKLGYKERAHIMNPMVPGLAGGKMSASDPDSKIDVLDPPEAVAKKLKKAVSAPKEVEGNGIISFVEYVLLPASKIRSGGEGSFKIDVRDGEPLVYGDVKNLKDDYSQDRVTPQMLKPAVIAALNALLEPVQKAFKDSREWQEIEQKAYPPPPKKVKKEKKIGTKYGGGKPPAAAKPDGQLEGEGAAKTSVAESASAALKNLAVEDK